VEKKKLAMGIKQDVKSFYAYVRGRSKARIRVRSLVDVDGGARATEKEMSEELHIFFASVFTTEDKTLMPTVVDKVCGFGKLQDLEINETMVFKKLEKLRMDKAPGADNLLPKFLKEIINEISYPLTIVLSKSFEEGLIPDDWKLANVSPVFKKGSRGQVGNIDRLV
jgi:hypothetical protein